MRCGVPSVWREAFSFRSVRSARSCCSSARARLHPGSRARIPGWRLWAIAPSVLMVAVLAVFRGYYQGRSNMVPTAVSQVIESLGKLFIGLGLAYYAVQHNFSDQAVAAMTVLGVTIGEVAAAVYMLIQGAITHRAARQCTRWTTACVRRASWRKRCSVCPSRSRSAQRL